MGGHGGARGFPMADQVLCEAGGFDLKGSYRLDEDARIDKEFARLEDIEIAVIDFDLMKTLKVDGVLGSDYLRRFRLVIDYDNKVIKIDPA